MSRWTGAPSRCINIVSTILRLANEGIGDMRTRIDKWGNSLAVRIPAALAREIAMRKGQEVNVDVEDGRLVITAVAERPRYSLDDILKGFDENEPQEEIDWGLPVGNEVW